MTATDAVKIIADKKKHKFYKDAVDMAVELAIHADGEIPGDLLKERRPKESVEIQRYREKIYISKTEAPVFKVMNSLMKIRKSQDWMIKYEGGNPSTVAESETLEQYMEYNFPNHTSFTNWFFAVAFRPYLVDANAVSLAMPVNLKQKGNEYGSAQPNEYLQPYPVIYNSDQIIDYKQNDYYILHSREKSTYTTGTKTYDDGNIYYVVTSGEITELRQNDAKPSYEVITYKHNLGFLPVVKLGGWIKKEQKDQTIYKSRISPMLPELKEAVREYSDLQAEVVQHIHSTLWAMEAQKCTTCKGVGEVAKKDAAPVKCKDCKGKGTAPFNPYEHYVVRQPKAGETAAPTPPIGYIQKDIAICQLQDKRVQDHIYYALSSINFEFLAKSPLNQSGYAKDVDRSELNNFVHSIAEDIVRIFDDHYYVINEYRYKVTVPNKKQREAMLPSIPVPQKYDILSEEYIVNEIQKLKTASIDPAVINACLIDYANKKFGSDEDARNFIVNCIELDPFASENEDAITQKLSNGGISKVDYTIHCNIKTFVRKAVNKDDKFYSKSFEDKQKIMEGYANEIITTNSAAGKVIQMMQQPDSSRIAAG